MSKSIEKRAIEVAERFKRGDLATKLVVFKNFNHKVDQEGSKKLQALFYEAAISASKDGNPAITAVMLSSLRESQGLSYDEINKAGVAKPFVDAIRSKIKDGWVAYAVFTVKLVDLQEINEEINGEIKNGLVRLYKIGSKNEAEELASIAGIRPDKIKSASELEIRREKEYNEPKVKPTRET